MIFYLLLQNQAVASNSFAINWALAGTIVASLISAAAAIRASNKASKTAREVAHLSESTAQALKDKEFRNDYYKKIIDRRLVAYESLEKLVSSFSKRRILDVKTSVGMGTHEIYYFFESDAEYVSFFALVNDLLDKTLWFSTGLKKEILALQHKLAEIGNSFGVPMGQPIDDDTLRIAGINYDVELKIIRKRITTLFKRELIEIQDINRFFEGLGESVED
jgi:hypothetical protein